jgi:hypothetical protein
MTTRGVGSPVRVATATQTMAAATVMSNMTLLVSGEWSVQHDAEADSLLL